MGRSNEIRRVGRSAGTVTAVTSKLRNVAKLPCASAAADGHLVKSRFRVEEATPASPRQRLDETWTGDLSAYLLDSLVKLAQRSLELSDIRDRCPRRLLLLALLNSLADLSDLRTQSLGRLSESPVNVTLADERLAVAAHAASYSTTSSLTSAGATSTLMIGAISGTWT